MASLMDLALQPNTEPQDAMDSVTKGIQTGIGLAQAKQDMEQKKLQVQSQKEQLQQAQMNGIANRLKAAAFAPDTQRETLMKNTEMYAQQAGVPFDGQAFRDLMKDPNTRVAVQKGLYDLQNGKVPPQQFLEMLSSAPQLFQTANEMMLSNADKQNKFNQALEVQKAKTEGIVQGAAIRGGATVEAAKQRGETSMVRNQTQANAQYTSTMKMSENGLTSAHRALDIINKVDTNELKANKALRADLTGTMASLVSNGRPSTVYGQSHQEFDSAFQNVMDKMNYLKGAADTTLPPEQLKQLKIDIQALQGLYAEQHKITYQSFREGLSDQLQPKLDARYKKYREGMKISDTEPTQSAAPAAPAGAPPATPPPPAFNKDAFVKDAKAKGKTDAEIAAFLATKGIK